VLKNVQAIAVTQQNHVVQVYVIKRHNIAVTVNIKSVYPLTQHKHSAPL